MRPICRSKLQKGRVALTPAPAPAPAPTQAQEAQSSTKQHKTAGSVTKLRGWEVSALEPFEDT
jgi:hypothetical protein